MRIILGLRETNHKFRWLSFSLVTPSPRPPRFQAFPFREVPGALSLDLSLPPVGVEAGEVEGGASPVPRLISLTEVRPQKTSEAATLV